MALVARLVLFEQLASVGEVLRTVLPVVSTLGVITAVACWPFFVAIARSAVVIVALTFVIAFIIVATVVVATWVVATVVVPQRTPVLAATLAIAVPLLMLVVLTTTVTPACASAIVAIPNNAAAFVATAVGEPCVATWRPCVHMFHLLTYLHEVIDGVHGGAGIVASCL